MIAPLRLHGGGRDWYLGKFPGREKTLRSLVVLNSDAILTCRGG